MGTYVTPEDFAEALPTASAGRLAEAIADAEAMALYYAPGLAAPAFLADEGRMAQAKAVLRAAVIYQVDPPNDGDAPRSPTVLSPTQVAALRGLTRGKVALSGVYTLRLTPDI